MTKLSLTLLVGISLSAATASYSYDAAGRLAKVDYGVNGSITYTYDNAGNLLSRTVVSAAQSAEAKKKTLPVKPAVVKEKRPPTEQGKTGDAVKK